MTPREIALSICEPWFNDDPCEGCKCHKVCIKLVERIETAIQAERVPETNFGNMAQGIDSKEADHMADTNKKADHIPDATKMMATINESETVEPVAYVTGYFDGKCVIRPLEHVVFPTGMALYRSPPKREPLTTKEIQECVAEIDDARLAGPITALIRAVERKHGIGGEE